MIEESLFNDFMYDFDELFKQNGTISREQFMSVVRTYKGLRIYFPERAIDRIDIHNQISRRIGNGWKRKQIVKQFIEHKVCCSSTAYNWINEALNNQSKNLLKPLS